MSTVDSAASRQRVQDHLNNLSSVLVGTSV